MNTLFRVVWNHALGCFTVVSELARGKTKSSTSTKSPSAQINTLFATSLLFLVSPASAAALPNPENGASVSGPDAVIQLKDRVISVNADNAHGIYAENGGTANGLRLDIFTQGIQGHAAFATGYQSNINLSDGTVNTTGAESHALVAQDGGLLRINNVQITTSGINAWGVWADANGSSIQLDQLSITTTGDFSDGVQASNGAHITLNNSTVSALGYYAHGLVIRDHASVDADHLTIGAANEGLVLDNGSFNGSHITLTQGNEGSAILLAGDASAHNRLTLNDSTLSVTGENSRAIVSTGATSEITLNNSHISALDGAVIDASGQPHLTLNLNHSSLRGGNLLQPGFAGTMSVMEIPPGALPNRDGVVINASNGSSLQFNIDAAPSFTQHRLNLDSASTWRGAASGLHSLSLKNNSQWTITNNSRVGDVELNSSQIAFAPATSGFSTLTAESWHSNNGSLVLNTQLGDDRSPTNQLQVSGDASGVTKVTFNNAGGSGAQTLEGIQVISVAGTTNGDFVQDGRVQAGAYDYKLVRKAASVGDRWYLSSKVIDDGDDNGEGGGEVDPGKGDHKMALRPETASYTANIAAANTLFSGGLHDRLGDLNFSDGEEQALWLRNIGGHTRFTDNRGQLKTQTNRYGLQLGGDLLAWQSESSRTRIGVMAGYGNAQSHSHSSITGYHASSKIHGYSSGGYLTWMQNRGDSAAFADAWALYNWFDNSVQGDGSNESYQSSGITASVEGGYNLFISRLSERSTLYLQPKMQLSWSGIEADRHVEANGTRVESRGDGNITTRFSLRTFLQGHNALDDNSGRVFEPFVELAWINNSKAYGAVLNGVSVSQAGTRNIGELKTGVEAYLTRDFSLWGNVSQQIGDKGYSDTGAQFGLRFMF